MRGGHFLKKWKINMEKMTKFSRKNIRANIFWEKKIFAQIFFGKKKYFPHFFEKKQKKNG
jgi:hypothetical protein